MLNVLLVLGVYGVVGLVYLLAFMSVADQESLPKVDFVIKVFILFMWPLMLLFSIFTGIIRKAYARR